MNPGQKDAIDRAYSRYVKKGILPAIDYPPVPETFADKSRRRELVDELKQSNAKQLVLLGDEPITNFLDYYYPAKSLAELTQKGRGYGRVFDVDFDSFRTKVLPLVHPRQACRLGYSSNFWAATHQKWVSTFMTSQ